jgi:hypothetical protein
MTTSASISQESRPSLLRGLLGVLFLSLLVAPLDAQSVLIERKPVQSSDLASVGYDAKLRLLEIEFHSGGIYRYREVPPEIHGQLLAAGSKGRFFATRIRDQFRCERVKARASAAR